LENKKWYFQDAHNEVNIYVDEIKYRIDPKNNKVVKKTHEVSEIEIGTLFIIVD
jgi:hypothetical protein